MNIDGEAINKAVAEAILNSALGTSLAQIIDQEVAKFSRTYDNPLRMVIEREVARHVQAVVQDEYGEQIKAAVRAQITDATVEEVTAAAWKALLDKLA